MERFFFFILLLVMLMPALLSLVFASRHWAAVLWNGLWYMALSEVAIRAFGSPNGKYVGLVFFALYIFKALARPRQSIRFQFHQMNRTGPRPSRPAPRSQPQSEREVRPLERDVIEAEYKRIENEAHS